MGLFSLVLIVGMPYLMDSSKFFFFSLFLLSGVWFGADANGKKTVDDETRAEFEEMQKKSPLATATNPAQQLQNFDLASFLAGKTDQAPPQEQKLEKSGGSSKKRG